MKKLIFFIAVLIQFNLSGQNCFNYENDLFFVEQGRSQSAGSLGEFSSNFEAGYYRIETTRSSSGLEIDNLVFYVGNLTYTFNTSAHLPLTRLTEVGWNGAIDRNAVGYEKVSVKFINVHSGTTCNVDFTVKMCDPNICQDNIFTSYQNVLGDGAGVHKYAALVGDFGGNDKTDIVFIGQDWNGRGLNIRTKISNGDGTYTSQQQVLGDGAGVHKYAALVGDFGGNNKMDIAFIGQTWNGCNKGLNVRIKNSQSSSWTSECQILQDGEGVHIYPTIIGNFAGNNKTDIVFIGQNWNGQGLNVRTKLRN